MAKSVVQKKQRVAHNTYKDDKMLPENHDFMSSYLEDILKNDLSAEYFNGFEANTPQTNKTFVRQKTQSNRTITPTQNDASLPKSQKFCMKNQFPLLEKCTRTLKQIKHNRQMPKPKAHLVSLSKSPLEDFSQSSNYNSISVEKSKKADIVGKNTSKSQNKVNELEHGGMTVYESKRERHFTRSFKESPFKIHESTISRKKSIDETSELFNSFDKASSYSSDSDMFENFIKKNRPKKSKSEKNSSKKLRKSTEVLSQHISKPISLESESESDMNDETRTSKQTNTNCNKLNRRLKVLHNRQSISKRNHTSESKVRKNLPSRTISKSVSSESDSNMSDDRSSCYTRSKRMKSHKVQDNRPTISEEESGTVQDETCLAFSSSNNNLPAPSEVFPCLPSNSYDDSLSLQKTNVHNSVLRFRSLHGLLSNSLSGDQSSKQEDNVHYPVSQFSSLPKTCIAPSVSDIQLPALHKISSNISCGVGDKPTVFLTEPPSHEISLVDNDQSNSKCIIRNDSVLNSIQKNSNRNIIVDLTESDNECENSFTIIPKNIMSFGQIVNDSHSEESDIEMVDIIVHDLPKNLIAKYTDENVGCNFLNDTSSKVNIKAENVDQSLSCIKPNTSKSCTSLPNSLNNKHGAMYITGVCKEYDKETESKDKILKQLNLNKPESSIPNKNLESCDGCEIVLDSLYNKNPNLKLPDVQISSNTNEKTLKDFNTVEKVAVIRAVSGDSVTVERNNKFTEKEQKLNLVEYSDLRHLTEFRGKNSEFLERMSEIGSVKIKALLNHLKKEFATYREIIQAGQTVEHTLKLLEHHQAEKVKSLKSELTKYMKSTQKDSGCSPVNAVNNKLLNNSELTNSKTLKDSTKTPICLSVNSMSDISVKDLKTFDMVNLVPLSSISENDIKPNLSVLPYTLKQETSVSDEINSIGQNWSFGQKCMVCAKDASAACQQCCKVFFCSNECGNKYWEDGHKNCCKYL